VGFFFIKHLLYHNRQKPKKIFIFAAQAGSLKITYTTTLHEFRYE
jgi:hypothetical protein